MWDGVGRRLNFPIDPAARLEAMGATPQQAAALLSAAAARERVLTFLLKFPSVLQLPARGHRAHRRERVAAQLDGLALRLVALLGMAAVEAYSHAGKALHFISWHAPKDELFLSTPALEARLQRLTVLVERHGAPVSLFADAFQDLLLLRTDTDDVLSAVDAALSKLLTFLPALPPRVAARVFCVHRQDLLSRSPFDAEKRLAYISRRWTLSYSLMQPKVLQEYYADEEFVNTMVYGFV